MARADAGLTISELARRADVSRDTISNAERGEHSLQASTLHKVARALGKAPSELLAEEERLAPKVERRSSFEPSLFNGTEDEQRSPLSPWAEYARRMADRIRLHTADAHSPAFRDPWAALFFIEERNHDAAELWLHFEDELGREPLADEPLVAFNAALAAFEELAESLAEAKRRAEGMAAGFAESEIGQARRRAAEAAAQREQAVAQFNARWERRGA